jgi:hypothetical protein
VVVLDVGPHMANYLPALRKSVFLLAESKVHGWLGHSAVAAMRCIAAA